MKPLHIIAALLLTGTLSLPSMGSSKVLELGHEASLSMIELPASETSELTLRKCTSCNALRLRASAETRYQVGKRRVSLAELKQYIATSPVSGVIVMQFKGSNELSRIVVSVPAGLAQ